VTQIDAHHRPPITISVREAAQLLGISKSHAYDLIRQEQLPHVRLGRRVVVPYRELEEWVRSHIDGDG
jgi:excisionase family DNA binding protein